MYVAHDPKILFVSVPHTKSTSTRKWLESAFGAYGIGHPHSTDIPDGTEEYFAWSVVRNPHDRALAIYKKMHRGPDRAVFEAHQASVGGKWPGSFEEFCFQLAEPGQPNWPSNNRQFVSQNELLRPSIERIDMLFKFESVPEKYAELPFVNFVIDFPHRNHNRAMRELSWGEVDSPATRRYIDEWAGDDWMLYEVAR